MKKKIFAILIWLIIINILINIFYYLIMENGINILMPQLAFKLKYYFREVVEAEVDYNDLEKCNVVSKNNASIKLSNINYQKDSGELQLKFEFYTNNDYILENIGGVLRVYDDQKIFSHNCIGGGFGDWENIQYLLISEDMYRNVDFSNEYNKQLYGELDDSNLNIDRLFSINSLEDYPIIGELSLNLGKGYEISDNLYIDFLDFQYKSVDEFVWRKAIEPLGELKFIVNF